MSLYFGYGSNLDADDFATFCRAHDLDAVLRPLAPAWLPDHELAFDYRSQRRGGGALNIRASIGRLASGLLFEVDDKGWAALDRKEGAPHVYRRMPCVVLDRNGHERRAQTYAVIAERRGGFTPPSATYLQICRRGRDAHGVARDDLEAVAAGREAPACDGLFVYGTLLSGELRQAYLESVRSDGRRPARVRGRLVDHGDYPGLTLADEGWVSGEYLATPEIAALLVQLDEVEAFHGFGHNDNLYRRATIEVDLGNGRAARAWTYITMRPQAPPIASGDWRVHRRHR